MPRHRTKRYPEIPSAAFAAPIGSVTVDTHWACACVKLENDGTLKAIKVHANSVKRCRVCGRKPLGTPKPNTRMATVADNGVKQQAASQSGECPNPPND